MPHQKALMEDRCTDLRCDASGARLHGPCDLLSASCVLQSSGMAWRNGSFFVGFSTYWGNVWPNGAWHGAIGLGKRKGTRVNWATAKISDSKLRITCLTCSNGVYTIQNFSGCVTSLPGCLLFQADSSKGSSFSKFLKGPPVFDALEIVWSTDYPCATGISIGYKYSKYLYIYICIYSIYI